MDWNDLASSNLPTLRSYPKRDLTITSSVPFPPSTNVNGAKSLLDRQDNMQQQPQPTRKLETLETLIRRNEHKLFTSLVQQYNDESHQIVSKLIDDQLEEMWKNERDIFVKNMNGGKGGNRTGQFVETPFRTVHPIPSNDTKLDPTFVVQHWKVVERIGERSITESVNQFSRITSEMFRQNVVPFQSSMMAYESNWQLISNLISVPNTPVEQARATLSHLCHIFQLEVTSCVRKASLVGHDTKSSFSNDVAAQCEVYTRLTVGGGTDPWVIAYFCLRCGDAHAALQVMEQLPIDNSIRGILLAMTWLQGNTTCIWDSPSTSFQLDPSDRLNVTKLIESIDDVETNDYQKAVLTLLSGATTWSINFKTKVGFKTVEDYLTGALWTAILQPNPIDHIIHLSEQIIRLGPSYFHDPTSGGWSYAVPLFITQQYHTALQYLADYGGKLGLLQSTHIGLILSLACTSIRNLGKVDTSDEMVTNLLVAYSNKVLKDHGQLTMLDYFVRIPNKTRAQKEVSNLIATSDDIPSLVGTLNAEGVRQGGAVSKHFSDVDLSRVLLEASDLLAVVVDDQQKIGNAVMCLMLAGRYDDALSMMNHLIAPPNTIDNGRSFWLEQVSLFHTYYISNRSHVLNVLEQEGKTSVIRTSRQLMDLNLFFDRLRQGSNTAECKSIAEKTQLLPKTEGDRLVKESEYKELDPLVQNAFPYLLTAVVQILSREYNQLKLDLHRETSGIIRVRLNEVKEHAKLLTSFASSLDISSYHIGNLTQLISLMI